MKLISKGAEAEIYAGKFFGLDSIFKLRLSKKYRHERLDRILRTKRTKLETTLIAKAKETCRTPAIYNVDVKKGKIIMERIEGTALRDVARKERLYLLPKLAKIVAELHSRGIIHGDLTTANVIVEKNSKKLALIDFGLGFFSARIEDKATDLLNLKKTIKALHSEKEWEKFIRSYIKFTKEKDIVEKIQEIEKRARYVWR
ncbi:MAG: Kae1-associated serine/threonine protein kinase [Candidatus Diapherotrites archaeon]|nr:Kae1-associated serine/threonine protein kinase [Candidatus Diapherotrites archaeon]